MEDAGAAGGGGGSQPIAGASSVVGSSAAAEAPVEPAALRAAMAEVDAPSRSTRARRRWADVAAVVGLLALAVAYYYPLTTSDRIAYDFDIWVFFYPLRQYAADALRAGRFPLWTPDIFLGSPFFANAQTAVLYPLNAVFLLLPVPVAYSVSLWLHTWLAAAFTYLLARGRLGLGVVGALVAALAFGFGGFVTGLAGHINQLQAAAWLPLLAWLLLGAIGRRSVRWGVAAAGALTLQVLAGHTQEVYLTLVALGVLALLAPWLVADGGWMAGGRRLTMRELAGQARHLATQNLRRRGLAQAVGGAVRSLAPKLGWALGLYGLMTALGLALAAVQLVPTAELQREGIRGGGLAYGEAISFSLPPTLLLQSLLPGFWRNLFGEYVSYIGTIPLCLAVLALAVAPGRWVLAAALLAGLGLFLALGGYNPLYPTLYEIVPGLGLFRVPARWLFVYSFGAALLAGLGAEWVWRAGRIQRWWRLVSRPRALAVAVLAAAGLVALVGLSPPLGARRFALVWGGLAAVAAALVALGLMGPRRLALGALAVAVAAELVAASTPAGFRDAIPPEVYRAARPVLAPLLAEGDRHRVLSLARDDYALGEIAVNRFPYPDLPKGVIEHYTVAAKHNEVLTGNVPLEYHLASVDGYDGGVLPLRRWVELMRLLVAEDEPRPDGLLRHRLHYLPDERLLDLLGVRWVLSTHLQDAAVDGVPFDRLATRRLRPGERFELPVAGVPADAVALLSSVADTTLADGARIGRVTVAGADGRAESFDVQLGRDTGRVLPQADASSALPTVPPPNPRVRSTDYAARLPLPPGTRVARLELENVGTSGTWLVRAATLVPAEGTPYPLLLSTALEPVPHDDPSPVKPYRTRAEPSVARLVAATLVADDAAALEHLRGPAFAPDRMATVAPGADARALAPEPPRPPRPEAPAAAPAPPPGQEGTRDPASVTAGTVRVVERAPERWAFQTDAPGERLLVVPQAYFPGWEARVDGTVTPVVRADYFFQGVYVPAGTHRIELTYRPTSVTIGLLVSLAALVVAIAACVPNRVRRRAGTTA